MQRPSAQERHYTAAWAKASKGFLADNPLCLGCRAVGRIEAARLTDHIVPHRGDLGLFWRRGNWQPSCAWHHDSVKQQLERRFDAGEVGADDLRLDSAAAVALTHQLRATGGGSKV